MDNETTRQGLEARQFAPLELPTAGESLNSMRKNSVSNVNSPDTASKPLFHSGSGYNLRGTGMCIIKAVKSAKSHTYFKVKQEGSIHPTIQMVGFLEHVL